MCTENKLLVSYNLEQNKKPQRCHEDTEHIVNIIKIIIKKHHT